MPEYFDLQRLSEYIFRSKGAIRNLVLRRQIPYKKPAGRLLFIREEIDEWILASEGMSFNEVTKESDGGARSGNGPGPGQALPSVKKPTRRGVSGISEIER